MEEREKSYKAERSLELIKKLQLVATATAGKPLLQKSCGIFPLVPLVDCFAVSVQKHGVK